MNRSCSFFVVALLALTACNGTSSAPANGGSSDADPWAAKRDRDRKDLREGIQAVGSLIDRGIEHEQSEQATQASEAERIRRAVVEVQQAIDAGDLDHAEAKLADIFYRPPGRGISSSDESMIAQTNEQRSTLRSVIERKRAQQR